jgi:pilus assembly protein TadC
MRDHLGIFISLVLLILGGVLVYDGIFGADPNQSTRIIGGAALVSLGLINLRIVLKNWWKWRKLSRDYRDV